ncbi:hypothetical protein BDR07DRAFT_1378055 [Suillus spraguei]|nr:hypothetical protein BDR07DRAFT_1378055 [Suillus spraguei]
MAEVWCFFLKSMYRMNIVNINSFPEDGDPQSLTAIFQDTLNRGQLRYPLWFSRNFESSRTVESIKALQASERLPIIALPPGKITKLGYSNNVTIPTYLPSSTAAPELSPCSLIIDYNMCIPGPKHIRYFAPSAGKQF